MDRTGGLVPPGTRDGDECPSVNPVNDVAGVSWARRVGGHNRDLLVRYTGYVGRVPGKEEPGDGRPTCQEPATTDVDHCPHLA